MFVGLQTPSRYNYKYHTKLPIVIIVICTNLANYGAHPAQYQIPPLKPGLVVDLISLGGPPGADSCGWDGVFTTCQVSFLQNLTGLEHCIDRPYTEKMHVLIVVLLLKTLRKRLNVFVRSTMNDNLLGCLPCIVNTTNSPPVSLSCGKPCRYEPNNTAIFGEA
jgi:hypothetical protein